MVNERLLGQETISDGHTCGHQLYLYSFGFGVLISVKYSLTIIHGVQRRMISVDNCFVF